MKIRLIRAVVLFSALLGLSISSALAQDDDALIDALRATWEGYKARYILCGADCGNDLGLVFDPSARYHAVSEGVGYGMIMAALIDDQATFDRIYYAANEVMLSPTTGLYHWRANAQGQVTGQSAATDADQDIAIALIFAQHRVEIGEWDAPQGISYADQASALITAIYEHLVYEGAYLIPGDGWSSNGQDILNLSYFSPAWYRIFDEFQNTNNWQQVIENGYAALYATAGTERGLAPDWSQADGEAAFAWCDSNGRGRDGCRVEMTWEAIRVPWRIALDCLWFSHERACEWSRRGAAFLLESANGDATQAAQNARMFTLEGEFPPDIDYQTEGMIGMWLAGAVAARQPELVIALESRLLGEFGRYLDQGAWGNWDQAHTYYYNQSLAWMGAAVRAGLWDRFAP